MCYFANKRRSCKQETQNPTLHPRKQLCKPLHDVKLTKRSVVFFLFFLKVFLLWKNVRIDGKELRSEKHQWEKAWPTLLGCRKELIQCTTAALCFKAALMFIHFGIRAKKQTEVCLLKLPNSHNDMLTNNTIVMQRDNWTPQRLPVLISNLLKLAYCPFVFEVSLKCNWNAADMTFELHALEARSWTRSTLAEFSMTKGRCYLGPVTRGPRDIPRHQFCFSRMHRTLLTLTQQQQEQWIISIAMNLISIVFSLVLIKNTTPDLYWRLSTFFFFLAGAAECLWKPSWPPVSILLISAACKWENSILSQHNQSVKFKSVWDESNEH